jgi:2Fe-2S ferredoxin
MPEVTFCHSNGNQEKIEVPIGWTLMEAAIQNDVEGILAECGGGCACATCHIYIDEVSDAARELPLVTDMEGDMLECTSEPRKPNSRLSCQIRMTDSLAGLTVTIPDTQT